MHTFTRPREEHLHVARVAVTGQCPDCGAGDLRSYRVLSEGGWWNAVKCQACLASISREPAPALGSYVPLGTTVDASPTRSGLSR